MTIICACGCNQPYTPSPHTKNPRYIKGHYEQSAAGKLVQARGGSNGRGAAKVRTRKATA